MKSVKTRIEKDQAALRNEFGLDVFSIKYNLTGSDTHKNGEAVVILEDANGNKVVYKPRSLQADMALMGDQGVFAMEHFKDLNLPRANFLEKTDQGNTYGYMQHFSPKRRLSMSETDNFYQTMGELKIMSKYLGINDLHQDNVMVTDGGVPVIIDAETTFLPHVMTSPEIGASGLDAALTVFHFNNNQTSNSFTVEGEGEINPFEASDITRQAKDRFVEGSIYKKMHLNGQSMALVKILNMPQNDREVMMNKMRKAGEVRLVPLSTADFQYMRQGFWTEENSAEKEALINNQAKVIQEGLQNKGYEITLQGAAVIKQQLQTDHLQGDIPYFSFDTTNFRVKYGGIEVGNYTKEKSYQTLIRKAKEGILKYFYEL